MSRFLLDSGSARYSFFERIIGFPVKYDRLGPASRWLVNCLTILFIFLIADSHALNSQTVVFFGFQSKTLDSSNRDILKDVVLNNLKSMDQIVVSSNQQYIPNLLNSIKMYGYDKCETPGCYSIFAGMFGDVKVIVGFIEDDKGYNIKFDLYNPATQSVEKTLNKKMVDGLERVNIGLKGVLFELLSGYVEFGKISVITTPPKCSLFIDGIFLGETPIKEYAMSLGKHKVAIIKTGMPTYNEEIEIQNGKHKMLNISMSNKIKGGESTNDEIDEQSGDKSEKSGIEIPVRLLGEWRYLIPFPENSLVGQANVIGGIGLGVDFNRRWGIRFNSLLNLYTTTTVFDSFYQESLSGVYYILPQLGPLSILVSGGYDLYLIFPNSTRETGMTFFASGLHAGFELDLEIAGGFGLFVSPAYFGMLSVEDTLDDGVFNFSGISVLSGLEYRF